MKAALSVMFEDVRGKAGNVVLARSQVGPSVRSLTIPANPRTAVQQAIRRNLARAAAAYRDLEPAVAQVWRDYAAAHPRRDPTTGATYVLGPNSFFIGFAGKLLQIQDDLPAPFLPPPGPFGGDPLTLDAAWADQDSPPAPGRAGSEFGGGPHSPPAPGRAGSEIGRRQHSPPAPGGAGGGFGTSGEAESPTQIRFTANRPNSPGVLTEILLQPLPTRNRMPQPREYRTQAFVAFTPDRLEFDLPIPGDQPPAFAPAYRFVNANTGQTSPLLPLPVLYR